MMPDHDKRIQRVLIVGASVAGLSAAETLRRQGFAGSVTILGDEPHLPYDRPPLSKQVLSGEWPAESVSLRTRAALEELSIRVVLGCAATGLDLSEHRVSASDGVSYEYDAVIVATGVRPRRLPGMDDMKTGIHLMRTVDDAVALRDRLRTSRHVIVVGAGFLGGEIATVARQGGARVTMFEPDEAPLAGVLGRSAGAILTDLYIHNNVDLRLGQTVTRVVAVNDECCGVLTADGDLHLADNVVVAIGSEPNTGWLDDSGLKLGDGLVCDEFNSAADAVYAAGDVARWYNPLFETVMRIEHRTTAAEQAVSAARNVLATDGRRPFAPVPYFWSHQFGLQLHSYGYTKGHDVSARLGTQSSDEHFLIAYGSEGKLVAVLACGLPPAEIRQWRAAIAGRTPWDEVVGSP
jgi:NADPH-dependent 2,4-dienoyl-CoA reductase/sulfur reductase-like enzyme